MDESNLLTLVVMTDNGVFVLFSGFCSVASSDAKTAEKAETKTEKKPHPK